MSIRWKIAATCLVVVFVPIYLLHRHTLAFFDQFTRQALEEQIIDYAVVVGGEYKAFLAEPNPRQALPRYTRRLDALGAEFQTRIRLLNPAGQVVYDSHPATSAGLDMSGRPEVSRALAGRYGARAALTPDRRHMYYFIALPIVAEDQVIGVAYLSRHTGPIIQAINSMVRHYRWAAAGALTVAALVAVGLAYTLTFRLRRLRRAVLDFAAGRTAWSLVLHGRDEISDLGRACAQMAGEISRKNAYNRDFLATVAHELKTPVTAIKGAAEVLDQGAADQPGQRRKFLANIQFEADRLLRLVASLQELTRLDAEDLRGKKKRVDWAACVAGMVERLGPAFDRAHAPIRLELAPGEYPVDIQPDRMEQVLANLLDNAVRYTPAAGAITVAVAPGAGAEVLTAVRDSGPGIAAANLPRVFDRFFTTEPHDQARDYGRGLGLAIAQTIVAQHGGRIWAESPPGQGAAFYFTLPRAGA